MTEYQYNVEVRSRFSLFLNDPVGNEDPNLFLSRLQSKREKSKKDKVQPAPQQVNVAVKPEVTPKPEIKSEPVAPKVVQQTAPKSPKTPTPAPVEADVDSAVKTSEGNAAGSYPMRGRGSRPPSRGFRGGRGLGSRSFAPDVADMTDEAGDQRETHYEPRGRGRGRGRGAFSRGMHSNQDRMTNKSFEHDDARGTQAIDGDEKINGSEEHAKDADVHDSTEPKENGEECATAEEEPKILTLEEYKALKKLTKPTVVLNTQGSRQANDGKDVFANMVAIRKAKEIPENPVKVKEPVQQEQQPIDIVVSFTDGYNSRGRGRAYRDFTGRGDRGSRDFSGGGYSRGARSRGGPRGRGRGSFRDQRDQESDGATPALRQIPPPSLDNDVEFPSLT